MHSFGPFWSKTMRHLLVLHCIQYSANVLIALILSRKNHEVFCWDNIVPVEKPHGFSLSRSTPRNSHRGHYKHLMIPNTALDLGVSQPCGFEPKSNYRNRRRKLIYIKICPASCLGILHRGTQPRSAFRPQYAYRSDPSNTQFYIHSSIHAPNIHYFLWFYALMYTANNFPFIYSQKDLGQASLPISTKYLQNRIIMISISNLNS